MWYKEKEQKGGKQAMGVRVNNIFDNTVIACHRLLPNRLFTIYSREAQQCLITCKIPMHTEKRLLRNMQLLKF